MVDAPEYLDAAWTKGMLEACWAAIYPAMFAEMEKQSVAHAAIFRDAVQPHMVMNIIPTLAPMVHQALNQVIHEFSQPMTMARTVRMNLNR